MSEADTLILFWFTLAGSAGVLVLLALWVDTWIKARKRRAQLERQLAIWVRRDIAQLRNVAVK